MSDPLLSDTDLKSKMAWVWTTLKPIFKVEQTRITVRESGVQLNLSCVDTPGFGDSVNNDKCWEPIIEFLENQFELYLNAESRVDRPAKIPDTRVHACLYFVAPSGHGLKPLDIEFMRRLHDKVKISYVGDLKLVTIFGW